MSAYFDVIFDQSSPFLFKESPKTKKEKLIRLEPANFTHSVIMSYLLWYIQLFHNSKNKSDTSWPALETNLDCSLSFSFFRNTEELFMVWQ